MLHMKNSQMKIVLTFIDLTKFCDTYENNYIFHPNVKHFLAEEDSKNQKQPPTLPTTFTTKRQKKKIGTG